MRSGEELLRLCSILNRGFAIAIFIADTITDLEIAGWCALRGGCTAGRPVLRGARRRARRSGCVDLTVLSFFLHPHEREAEAITNILLSISPIGLTTFLVVQKCRSRGCRAYPG